MEAEPKSKPNSKPTIEIRTIGVVAGLLTACLATLIGVFSGLDPFVVFVRASLSALVIGFVIVSGCYLVLLTNDTVEEEIENE